MPKIKLKITHNALLNLEEIYIYTLNQWGEKQADRYISQLKKRFLWLLDNSQLGKERSEIKKGYRSFNQGQHIIFYRISNNIIEILNILHQKMDIDDFPIDKKIN